MLNKMNIELLKESNEDDDLDFVIFGYGNNSVIDEVKKGEKVMVRYGNIIEVSLTRALYKQKLEDDLDDIIYSKPVAFVKKMVRNVKNRK